MRLKVDLLPQGPYEDVVVLIDVLRSSTVAPLLFDKGLKELYVCASLKASREIAASYNYVLLGERGGLPPEGFNYGNSPADLSAIVLDQPSAILTSENAPQALARTVGARHVLLGALYNADALVERALQLASEEISLVCCGLANQEDLDDALGAGFLASRMRQERPQAKLAGATALTISLLKAFPDPLAALWQSRTGFYLRRLGLERDIAIASFVSNSESVPELQDTMTYEETPLYRFSCG